MLKLSSRTAFTTAFSGLLALGACGPESEAEMDGGANPSDAAVEAAGVGPDATVSLEVTVEQEAEGQAARVRATMQVMHLEITPAGDTVSGTGHHHLYLNADLTPADQPVPSIPGQVVHLGDGSAEYVFEDVPPGEHRMIAVVADGIHIPLQPWVVDTVQFVVR